MFTRAYGQAPANTTLTVSYLEGGGLASNVGSGILNKVESVTYSMDEDGLDGDTLATSKSSLAVTNTFGATGGRNEETVEEIRQNALGAYATQNRAVTNITYLGFIQCQLGLVVLLKLLWSKMILLITKKTLNKLTH